MSIRFRVVDTRCTPLWDFGWLDVSRFEIGGDAVERRNGSNVLREFFRDPISRRSFCDPGPWAADLDRHGPLLRTEGVSDLFRPVSNSELALRVREILDDPKFREKPSVEQRAPVEAWIGEITSRGDETFALTESRRASDVVEWHWVWTLYHEFICVSPDRAELSVAVIGLD